MQGMCERQHAAHVALSRGAIQKARLARTRTLCMRIPTQSGHRFRGKAATR
jgi:hypothetical protein